MYQGITEICRKCKRWTIVGWNFPCCCCSHNQYFEPKEDKDGRSMTLISMDDALNVVRDTIAKAFENLPYHYDETIGDEVYDDISKVNLLLEVNKEIRANIRKLKRRD